MPGSADTSRVETGMDALPEGNRIHVEWDSRADAKALYYELYRAAGVDGPYSLAVKVEHPAHSVDDEVPQLNVRYHYFVRVVDDEGEKSDPSDTLGYKLMANAEGLVPFGAAGTRPVFRWRDANHANDYVLRLEDGETRTSIWFSVFQAPAFGPEEQSVAYNFDGRASRDSLARGAAYRWRVDVIGNESRCGSESAWQTISIE